MAELYEEKEAVSQYSDNVNNDFPNFAKSVIDFVLEQRGLKNAEEPMDFLVDVGCGSGGSTRIFAPYFKSILGVDPSEEQVVSARKVTKAGHIKYGIGSGESIPVEPGTVDVMVSYFAIQYMNIPKYVAECNRVLKPDGMALSIGHDYHNIELLGSETSQSVQDLLKSFFSCAAAYFTDNLPDLASWLDRYQSIYDSITGINKQRVDDISHQQNMTLLDFKLRLFSIPEYGSYARSQSESTGKNPIEELMADVKRRWNVTSKDEGDIKIRMTYSFFIICLRK